jgi:AcrR family transcriptional regulator
MRRRAARHQQLEDLNASSRPATTSRRELPITVDLIVSTAFEIVAANGYEALTMRGLAAALETGPASLYAHVVNKADLDELLIGQLCSRLTLPKPDPKSWREQVMDVCRQIRDQYEKYPGISKAAMAVVPTNLDTLRINEGLFGILLAGGIPPQRAAWGVDALSLYVNANSWEVSQLMKHENNAGEWVLSPEQLLVRFAALPDQVFPHIKQYAVELTRGSVSDRFEFAIGCMLDGLMPLDR